MVSSNPWQNRQKSENWRRERDSNPQYAKQNTRYFKWSNRDCRTGSSLFALDLPADGIADHNPCHRLKFRGGNAAEQMRQPSNRSSRPGQHGGPGDSRYNGHRGSARSPEPAPFQLPLTAVRHNDAAQRRGVDQQFSRRAPPAAINASKDGRF